MKPLIKITEQDYMRLSNMIHAARSNKTVDASHLEELGAEILRAKKVSPKKISPEFITMNSSVEIHDMDTNKSMVIKLVYPVDADFKKGFISVFSPLGCALLGYKEGDTIHFKVPKGVKEIKVHKIIYQPEAHGDYTA